jgi:hypothetical protein
MQKAQSWQHGGRIAVVNWDLVVIIASSGFGIWYFAFYIVLSTYNTMGCVWSREILVLGGIFLRGLLAVRALCKGGLLLLAGQGGLARNQGVVTGV